MIKNFFRKVVVGEDYLIRWWVIPRNRFCNVYVHKFIGDDKSLHVHDHPWWFCSVLLKGSLAETELTDDNCYVTTRIWKFLPRFYPATFKHRILLMGDKPAWTIVVTGPRRRIWGFHNRQGLVKYQLEEYWND